MEEAGKFLIAEQLRREFGLVDFSPPEMTLRPLKPQSDPQYGTKLNLVVRDVLGPEWRLNFAETAAAPSLVEQEEAREAEARAVILADPLIRAAMEAFPEAELLEAAPAKAGG